MKIRLYVLWIAYESHSLRCGQTESEMRDGDVCDAALACLHNHVYAGKHTSTLTI